jgi:hypothetical protein
LAIAIYPIVNCGIQRRTAAMAVTVRRCLKQPLQIGGDAFGPGRATNRNFLKRWQNAQARLVVSKRWQNAQARLVVSSRN